MLALKSVKTARAFWTFGSRVKERGWPDKATLRNASPSSEGGREEEVIANYCQCLNTCMYMYMYMYTCTCMLVTKLVTCYNSEVFAQCEVRYWMG